MQDIPRNQLLDKLADGWTVRRKNWRTDYNAHKDEDMSIHVKELLSNDWQGEPPLFRRFENCDCVFAFKELHTHGAKMVRRKTWEDGSGYEIDDEIILGFQDLIATDWEVWA